MKVYVTGSRGTIGRALIERGCLPLLADVRDYESVYEEIKGKEGIIVHLAAKTNLDYCEDSKNQEEIIQINSRGTMNVVTAAEQFNLPVVLISTVHVFSGRGLFPYGEYGPMKPVNFYGLSKIASEMIVSGYKKGKIVRTSCLFSREILKLDKTDEWKSISFSVRNQRSFLHVDHFVSSFIWYLQHLDKMPKTLNIAGTSHASWHEFMLKVADAFSLDFNLVTPYHAESPGTTRSPRNGKLNSSKARRLGVPLYSYQQGIEKMLADAHK